jgi:hypothetical protein
LVYRVSGAIRTNICKSFSANIIADASYSFDALVLSLLLINVVERYNERQRDWHDRRADGDH